MSAKTQFQSDIQKIMVSNYVIQIFTFQVIQSQNQSQQNQVTSQQQQQQQQQQQSGGQPDCRSEATSVCGDNSSVLSGFSSGPVNQQAGHQAGGNSLPPGSSAPTMTSASKVESVQELFFELGRKSNIDPLEVHNIFLLCRVIIRPTKIMNRAYKNRAHF